MNRSDYIHHPLHLQLLVTMRNTLVIQNATENATGWYYCVDRATQRLFNTVYLDVIAYSSWTVQLNDDSNATEIVSAPKVGEHSQP